MLGLFPVGLTTGCCAFMGNVVIKQKQNAQTAQLLLDFGCLGQNLLDMGCERSKTVGYGM